jgi:cytochrome P450
MVSRIQQSLSFHGSPEAFISSRLQQLSAEESSSLFDHSRPIVRASILNRNVHIISDYQLCKAILNGDVSTTSGNDPDQLNGQHGEARIITTGDVAPETPIFAAGPAYNQFMAAFFPGPNILLQDGPEHSINKAKWSRWMSHIVLFSSGLETFIRRITAERFINSLRASLVQTSGQFDLYEHMKHIAWDLLIAIFLNIERLEQSKGFREFVDLQEDLLRGQFSLFPVSINTPFYKSPRSKGLAAVKELQDRLTKRVYHLEKDPTMQDGRPVCPFMAEAKDDEPFGSDEIVAHLLVFTSSIANKAIASLLTAYLLNLFLWRGQGTGSGSLAEMVRSQEDPEMKQKMLESILAETERLSPPVVGVMRRVNHGIVLFANHDGTENDGEGYAVPARHDAWLYVAGASREPAVFTNADTFIWDRYMTMEDSDLDRGFAFGWGVKQCLGQDLARQICLTVVKTILDSSMSLSGSVADQGVRHWLGWEQNVPLKVIAKDLKQLPTQRPRRVVNVQIKFDS